MSDDYNVLCVDFEIAIDTAIEAEEKELTRIAANTFDVDESRIKIDKTYISKPLHKLHGITMKEDTIIEGVYYPE